MDKHIRIKMDAHIYVAGLMARHIHRASYSVPYVVVSTGSIESMPADVEGIGGALASGNAARPALLGGSASR
jgi:hypothetical protein